MRPLILRGLLSLILIQTATWAHAQSVYIIDGKVTDESLKPLAGATVFIDGSKIATATDATGQFKLTVPGAGSYHLSAKMLGYAVANKDVMLKEHSANIDFKLAVKSVVLNQINIGTDKNWAQHFEMFKKQFLGDTPNALACKIVNPEVINFSTKQSMLYADADEFLIIENPNLGYRIKYLLKTFQYDKMAAITSYDGDVIFEELPGTDAQKQSWTKNRQLAYAGSLMHFLRSVFTNTALREGFVAGQLYKKDNKQYYDSKPVDFDTLVTAIDTNFIALKFTGLHVTYSPDKVAQLLKSGTKETSLVVDSSVLRKRPIQPASNQGVKPKYVSDLMSYVKQVTIDASGRVFSGYLLSFLIRGDWTYRRVADQLPFEYQPPVKLSATP